MDKLKTIVKSSPFIISIIYIMVGIFWVLYSDPVIHLIFDDVETVRRIQIYKDWFFILASGILLFFLIYQSNFLIESLFSDTKKEQDKFKATFENAPVGIAHHRPNEKWMLVNKSLCKMLGYKKDELLQLNFEDFIHPNDLEEGRKLDQDLVNKSISNYKIEKKYKRKDGTEIDVILSKSAIYDDSGQVSYLIAIIKDITQQKEREAKLEQTVEEKKILLEEVHHRVKNNIALMYAWLDLQLMYSTSKSLQKVLNHYKTRLKSLSLIYENFNGVEREPTIDLHWYLNEQIKFLNYFFEIHNTKVRYQKNIQNLNLNINQAIPFGLISNEILTHTNHRQFQEVIQPFIAITLSEKDEQIIFSAENNGKKNGNLSNIHDSESLDYRIMNALVKQINGQIELDINKDREIFTLIFKKKTLKGSGSYHHPSRSI